MEHIGTVNVWSTCRMRIVRINRRMVSAGLRYVAIIAHNESNDVLCNTYMYNIINLSVYGPRVIDFVSILCPSKPNPNDVLCVNNVQDAKLRFGSHLRQV